MLGCKFLLSLCTTSAAIWTCTGFHSKTCTLDRLHFSNFINIDRAFIYGLWTRCSTSRGDRMRNYKYSMFTELLGLGTRTSIYNLARPMASVLCRKCILHRHSSRSNLILDINNLLIFKLARRDLKK